MNIYANNFNLAMDDQQTELIISFRQESPIFDEKGNISGVQDEVVGSFVMPFSCAPSLFKELEKLFRDDTSKSKDAASD